MEPKWQDCPGATSSHRPRSKVRDFVDFMKLLKWEVYIVSDISTMKEVENEDTAGVTENTKLHCNWISFVTENPHLSQKDSSVKQKKNTLFYKH